MPALSPTPDEASIAKKGWLKQIEDQRRFDRALAKILKDAANEGRATILRTVGDGVSETVRRSQIQLSVAALDAQSAELWGRRITPAIQAGIDSSAASAIEALTALDDILAETIGNPDLRRSFIEAAKNGADTVKARVLNEIKLSDAVYKSEAISRGWVEREVNRGLSLNRSAKEIADSVRKFIRPDVRGGVSYAAQRLGRTEINNAFHTLTIQNAIEQPWVAGFKWNISGSHPRHDECNDYAEKDHDDLGPGVFSKKSVPAKPHPQCLCYVTTIQVSDEEFINNLASGKYDKFIDENTGI